MADQPVSPGPSLAPLRIVLIVSGLVFLGLASVSLIPEKNIQDMLEWYDTKTAQAESSSPDTVDSTPPPTPLQTNRMGFFLLRIAALQLSALGLLCLMAAISPLANKGVILVMILLGLFTAAGAFGIGRRDEVRFVFYIVVSLMGLLLSLLLVFVYPYGRKTADEESQ